jgi:hypothetical protein
MEIDLFKVTKERKDSLRFEQYQTEHNSYIQRSINRLKNNWITSIRDIVENNLKKGQVSWFNFHIDSVQYQ